MYAVLKTAGAQPVVSERLNSSVKKGTRTSMTDLSVGVSSGSRAIRPQRPLRRWWLVRSRWNGHRTMMLWRTAAKHHQLKIEHRRPWRQSNHGTVGRRCCHRMGYHRGPRVHRLNATVDVEKTFRRRSSASKRTRACFEANCGRYDVPSSTPTQTPE